MAVKHAIDENKTQTIQKQIIDSNGDQNQLFRSSKAISDA